jgi:hypothetical protein
VGCCFEQLGCCLWDVVGSIGGCGREHVGMWSRAYVHVGMWSRTYGQEHMHMWLGACGHGAGGASGDIK